MKKIVLGCAAVLLSLGLLAGCNNKEDEPPITEAVSLSVSQTSVSLEPGGSAEVTYTVSPEKATVMALSDHEEYVTAVAQEGTIYLEAVAAGTAIVSVGAEYEDYASAEAQITVTVAEVVEPGPATPTVSLTLTKSTLNLVLPTDEEKESGETGAEVIGYEVVPTEEEGTVVDMEVTESTPTDGEETEAVVDLQNLEDGWTVTPQVPGTAEITVTATCEGYEPAEATIAVTVYEAGTELEPDPEEVTSLSNYTLKLTLQYNGSAIEVPNYGALYLVGGFNGTYNEQGWYEWDTDKDCPLTDEGSGVFSYTFETIDIPVEGIYGYEYNVLFCYNDESITWSPVLSANGWIDINASIGDNHVEEQTCACVDVANTYPELGSDVECYFCIYDVTGGTLQCTAIYMSSEQVVLEGENKYCTATIAYTNVNDASHAYAYGPNSATYPSGTSGLWMNWASGCEAATQTYWSDEIVVPSDCGSVATYIAQADLSKFVDYGETGEAIGTTPISAAWYAGEPATAINTMLGLSN